MPLTDPLEAGGPGTLLMQVVGLSPGDTEWVAGGERKSGGRKNTFSAQIF